MIVSPKTSTDTMSAIGSRGDLRKQRQYDGIRTSRVAATPKSDSNGRSTIPFLLASRLYGAKHAAAFRAHAGALSVLPADEKPRGFPDHSGGLWRVAGIR